MMKALILAGGRGSRLNQVSEKSNKCMLLFQNLPILEHSLKNIVKLPIDEIIILVGHRAEDIINYFGIFYQGKRIKYAIQQEQHGLVHAIECCKQVLDGDDFMLFLGDEIMEEAHHSEMLTQFYKQKPFAFCGVVKVSDLSLISKTYSIIINDEQQIFRLIEKPRNPQNNLMGTGNCIFSNKIFSYIIHTPINQIRHEKELPDLIQCAIDDGMVVKAFEICSRYVNINTKDDIRIIPTQFNSGLTIL